MSELRPAAAVVGSLKLLGDSTAMRDRVCDMLGRVPLFDEFAPTELQLIAGHMQAYIAEAGSTILHEGDPGGWLCLVINGRVGVYKQDEGGAAKRLATITPGKSFGEMSLLDDLPYSAGIVAENETTLLLISREDFRRLVDSQPELGVRLIWKIARLISLRLRQTSVQLVDSMS